MSGFGPPPGAPTEDSLRRPPSYLPPGGLGTTSGHHNPRPGMPSTGFPGPLAAVGGVPEDLAEPGGGSPDVLAAPGGGAGTAAYRRGPSVQRGVSHPLMATAHKPGIIPLRPMSTGDLLDGAVKHFRRNPGPVAGLSLLVLAVAVVPAVLLSGLALTGSWYSALGLSSALAPQSFMALLLALGVGFAALVLCGMLAHSVAEATLGRRPQLSEMWAAARPRLLPLIGLQLVVVVAIGVPVLLLILLVALVAPGPLAVLAVVGVLGSLAVAAWTAFVLARTVLAGPALVLEKRSVRDALRRGWALSAKAFWRLVGTALVVGALAVIVFFVLELPVILVGNLLTLILDPTPTVEAFLGALVVNLATLLAASVVVPFVAGANNLLYIDQRMRKEGFDLVLLRAAGQRPGAR